MPELPEVETTARSLDTMVRGRRIITAELRRERLAPDSTPEIFSESLSGLSINYVHRRGKHILIDLSSDTTLIVHLRMSGRFSLLDGLTADPKFTHALFHFEDEKRLVFDDQRHFGLMKIVPTSRLAETKELCKLAPEPFSDEFSVEYLHKTAKTSRRSLKEFLLDQTKVCGLGNIYASEAMFLAGLDPRKPADRLTRPKAALLHESILSVLSEAIRHALTREIDPSNIENSYFNGSSNGDWLVYGREGSECPNCGSPIIRVKQGGRSTYFCRKCQRK